MLLLVLASSVLAQPNPFRANAASDVEAGAKIFRANCAICHGLDGKGVRAPDLTTGRYRHGSTDEDLFKTIANGVKGTEMPPVTMEGRQTFQVIAFLRSIATPGGAKAAAGDAAKGRAIFEGKGGCLKCHMAGDAGSRLGPDLSDAGLRFSREHMIRSLIMPDDLVSMRYWYAEATGRDGRKYYGRRLNEDTHSVQILDGQERLTSLLKADLAEYRVLKKSAMPSYESSLSPAERDDLLAYLATLRN